MNERLHRSKRLGIPSQLITRPLTDALRESRTWSLHQDIRPSLARHLRERELDAALLSPLDYAKESSDYCIVPEAVVASTGNGSIVVRFREGIKHIGTLAVDPAFASEIILAKIILAEEFNLEPAILPMHASVDVMLQKADAALLTGDTAFQEWGASENIIDVVEEWNEMTGLPYVHALWCGWQSELSDKDVKQLGAACVKGVESIPDIALQFSKEHRRSVQEFLESFIYELTPDVRDGLAEFMKYLYYHGVVADIADLNFYKPQPEMGALSKSVFPGEQPDARSTN
jgi:chorismate dehydratase